MSRLQSIAESCWMSVPPTVRKRMIQGLYDNLSRVDAKAEVPFLNFGYAPTTVTYPDAVNRACVQLYDEAARMTDLRGRKVLEVSSGRGGGAAWVSSRYQPQSYVGLDLSPVAVEFCQRKWNQDGLTFVQGDAEKLPFPDGEFDVVLNVEAGLNYVHFDRFVAEVYRVLKPGGYLVFADNLRRPPVDALRESLRAPGFTVEAERDITGNVVLSLEERTEGLNALIEARVPRLLRRPLREFAALEGTDVYRQFRSRANEYWLFLLKK